MCKFFKKIQLLLLLLLVLLGCSNQKHDDNAYFYEEYNVEKTTVSLKRTEFNQITSFKKNFSGTVFFMRSDCNHSTKMLEDIIDHFNSTKNKTDNLFVVETNFLSENEKKYIIDNFYVGFVPAIVKFKSGSIVFTEVGIVKIENYKDIFTE